MRNTDFCYVFGLRRQLQNIPSDRWPFVLVSPTGGSPYSFFSKQTASDVFRGVRHHAHLYRLERDGTATLEKNGDADTAGVAHTNEKVEQGIVDRIFSKR